MPRGDRTGPSGMGPMTGRAAGYCADNQPPGFVSRFFGRGLGFRRGYGRQAGFQSGFQGAGGGFGRGWRKMFRPFGPGRGFGGKGGFSFDPSVAGERGAGPEAATEKQVLKGQVEALKLEMDRLQKRLNDLESPASDE